MSGLLPRGPHNSHLFATESFEDRRLVVHMAPYHRAAHVYPQDILHLRGKSAGRGTAGGGGIVGRCCAIIDQFHPRCASSKTRQATFLRI